MLTDRLLTMLVLTVIFGVLAAVLGHLSAIAVPAAFGYESTNTAGMIALVSGCLFFLATLLGPRHGIISKLISQARLSRQIAAGATLEEAGGDGTKSS
jgi:manganese/zinc/iron transport system permease protein